MTVHMEKEIENLKDQDSSAVMEDAKRRSELILKEATLEANKILFEANKKASSILEQKGILERKLKEFIDIEKELIKKYESDKS